MAWLYYYQKIRTIHLFKNHKLIFKKNKLEVKRQILLQEFIVVTIRAIRSLVHKFYQTGSVCNLDSIARRNSKTRVTVNNLKEIERQIRADRETTASDLKYWCKVLLKKLCLNISIFIKYIFQ
jgi:hypothetical protein